MSTELNYRISFTEMELGFSDQIVNKEYSTKWMSLCEALNHKAIRSDNSKLIKRL